MNTASVTSPIKRSPLGLMLSLAAIGAGIAGYLVFLHYAFLRGDMITAPACGGGGVFDCHLIALSTYALLAGRPVAAWGAALYGVWAALAVVGLAGDQPHRTAALRLITVTALAAVLIDGYFAWVMLTKIHAVCLWCVATYAVNLLVLLVGWSALRRAREPLSGVGSDLWLVVPLKRPPHGSSRAISVVTAAWCLTIIGSIWGVTEIVTPLVGGNPAEIRQQLRAYVQQQTAAQLQLADAPVRGAQHAAVRIVEFSDLLCPACQRASLTTTSILTNHPGQVQFAFRHYPLDGDCNPYVHRTVHPFACRVAAAASCAHAQDKFWALHDAVLSGPLTYDAARLEGQARHAGVDMARWNACLADGTGFAAVKRDIEEAQQLKVQSTPTFFINGYMFTGGIPPPAFEIIVQEFLQHKTQ